MQTGSPLGFLLHKVVCSVLQLAHIVPSRLDVLCNSIDCDLKLETSLNIRDISSQPPLLKFGKFLKVRTHQSSLWFDEWPVLSVHLVVEATGVAQVVSVPVSPPEGGRGCTTIDTLSANYCQTMKSSLGVTNRQTIVCHYYYIMQLQHSQTPVISKAK